MIATTKSLALVLCSITLVACGGGGGGGAPPPVADVLVDQPVKDPYKLDLDPAGSPVAADLQAYEGEWKQACIDHKQITTILKFVSAREFIVSPRKDYFEKADCTGAIVAIGGYDTYREKVVVAEGLQAASVDFGSGLVGQRQVNPAESAISTTSYQLFPQSVGGVTIDNSIPGFPVQYINYPDATKEPFMPEPKFDGGYTKGALLIENLEFLTLNVVPADPPAYIVNQRFHR